MCLGQIGNLLHPTAPTPAQQLPEENRTRRRNFDGCMGLAWPHKRWQWRAPTSGGIMRIGRHLDFPTHSPARTADFVSVHEMHQFLLHIIFVIVTITVHSRCSCLLSGPV